VKFHGECGRTPHNRLKSIRHFSYFWNKITGQIDFKLIIQLLERLTTMWCVTTPTMKFLFTQISNSKPHDCTCYAKIWVKIIFCSLANFEGFVKYQWVLHEKWINMDIRLDLHAQLVNSPLWEFRGHQPVHFFVTVGASQAGSPAQRAWSHITHPCNSLGDTATASVLDIRGGLPARRASWARESYKFSSVQFSSVESHWSCKLEGGFFTLQTTPKVSWCMNESGGL
jgi:hypothetical protein